ncbi:MAG: energy-coupling factor transporter ATPase [Desulfotomaculum sp.]|nr:energy-coupling factor transporter ATPase [Desulfotomaculum sp.]
MWAVEVKSLSYIHSMGTPFAKQALKDVSLNIAQGQIVGIIGPTGSGKSTLVQHFNGLLAPQKGSVNVLGRSTADKAVRMNLWKEVGLVFQYPEQQLFEETVYDDIAFGPKNLGLNEIEVKKRVIKALDDIGLPEEILSRSPQSLSGGMKRRVAIAGILAMQPKILVLDEPTAGLDPAAKSRFLNLIRKLQQSTGITVILVTHSIDDAAELAHWLVVMDRGRIALQGKPKDIFKQPERLIQIGLNVPVEIEVTRKLFEMGIPVRTDVLGLNEAVEEIARIRDRRKKTGG